MAHICLFPMKKNGGPIYGFDIIAVRKNYRCIPRLSPLLKKEHPLTRWFIEENKWFKPSKGKRIT